MNHHAPMAIAFVLLEGAFCLAIAQTVEPTRAAGGAVAMQTRTARVMSTELVVVAEAERIDEAAEVALAVFRDVEATMNEWRSDSPLAAVNRAAGEPGAVEIPEALHHLLRRSVALAALTDGAFDPTWAALWGIWDFRAEVPVVPAPGEVRRRVALVGWRDLELADSPPRARLKRQGMAVGLGGIAKGYALDCAAAELRQRGIATGLLSAGGQVYALGTKGGRPWRVGIRDPRGAVDDAFALLEVSDVSVSTSGDYERYFEHGGTRYHHILDPRTGMPATGLRSATIVAADATLADALSTAVMVLGPERGLKLVEGQPGVEAVLVAVDGRVVMTRGLQGRLVERHPPRR